jgi:RNA polymerase sigma-70 factor (ECF subfamily)
LNGDIDAFIYFIRQYNLTISTLRNEFESMQEEQQKYFIDLALRYLSSKEALALNLFYLEEYSVEEVSGLTGWSTANVKVTLFRARKNMYAELSKILKTEKKILY